MPRGLECPPQLNPTKVLSYDDWNPVVFEGLSDYLKGKIITSDEYKAMNAGYVDAQEVSDLEQKSDLPF